MKKKKNQSGKSIEMGWAPTVLNILFFYVDYL